VFLTVYLLGSISQPRYIRNMTPTWSVFGFGVTLLTVHRNGVSRISQNWILHCIWTYVLGLCMLVWLSVYVFI